MELEELKRNLLTTITLGDGTVLSECFVMPLTENLNTFVCTIQTYSFYCKGKRGKDFFRLSQLLAETKGEPK